MKSINIKKRGRKPIEDKKKPITIFVKESFIEKIGKEELQQKLLEYIEYLEKSKFSEWKGK
jgi:hypothetical protein